MRARPLQCLTKLGHVSHTLTFFNTILSSCSCRRLSSPPPPPAVKPATKPALSLDGITSLRFVPVVQHSQLVLYGIPTSPTSTDDHKLCHFPNAEAIRNFRIPKRRPPPSPSSALLLSSPLPSQDSSDAVQQSCCMRRFHAGLPSNPHSLTFTLSTSQGEEWSSNNLEGQGSMFVFLILILPVWQISDYNDK